MSKGISIFYKLIELGKPKVIYGYSGANINKEYDYNDLLDYDGLIEITIEGLKNKDLIEAINTGDIKILKECRYEWHEPRLINGDSSIGFFALKVLIKIFGNYKINLKIEEQGAIVY